ncbi:MAG: DNA-3-methyladenine glycosylase 2 family protein [Gemmatimonadetes bacterium]|nr:DNA-3-methyladenine glycosylase 2 family protein [Gemmatimonadota bacterium]
MRRFSCAAAAEAEGFRPCRRCRPETAPGTPAWSGTSGTVSRALRLISEGALDSGDVDGLADRLGVGARHLRRLFDRHLGASPIAIAQSRRVGFARTLIDQTTLPMGEIAFASGFSSVKRFNTSIRETFERTPSELRKLAKSRTAGPGRGISLRLAYRPPYAWDEVMQYLERRAVPGVEEVRDGIYRRSAVVDGEAALIEVEPAPEKNQAVVTLRTSVRREFRDTVERVRRVFDLEADPLRISSHLEQDPALRSAVRKRPGLRVPGAWDPFEIAVRAILGQQVSVKGATTLAGRLAARYGERIVGAELPGPTLLFPAAERLRRARLETLGMPATRASAIRELARRVSDGTLPLRWGEFPGDLHEQLTDIPGIGDWTAQYISLRALGQPDVFLPGDLGVRKALADADGKLPSIRACEARSEAWRPWRGYAVLHLWFAEADGKDTP